MDFNAVLRREFVSTAGIVTGGDMAQREAGAMATTISTRTAAITVEGDQCVSLHGIDWKGYGTMLRLRGERSIPKIVYLDGSLLLVSPSFPHEFLKKRFSAFVQEIVVGLKIPCIPSGSLTLRRQRKRGGVEGDESYYLAKAAQIAGKHEVDARTDPPPDLAIEIVHTHSARAAIEVYRRLGVSEVWVCDAEKLRVLVRQPNGRYADAESSAVFPFLKAAEIWDWVERPRSDSETDWMEDLRRWVRETLVPRRAATRA
jgi:Uma2 family endonuclease